MLIDKRFCFPEQPNLARNHRKKFQRFFPFNQELTQDFQRLNHVARADSVHQLEHVAFPHVADHLLRDRNCNLFGRRVGDHFFDLVVQLPQFIADNLEQIKRRLLRHGVAVTLRPVDYPARQVALEQFPELHDFAMFGERLRELGAAVEFRRGHD